MSRTRAHVLATLWLAATSSLIVPAAAHAEWKGAVTLGVDYQGWTDIDDPQGEFDFVHPSVGVRAQTRLGEDSRWSLAVAAEYRAFAYRFDGLAVGDVWDDVHVVRIAPRLIFSLNEDWALFGGPVGEFSAERGSDFNKSLRGGAIFGVQWRATDSFSIGIGALGMNKLADDFLIQPVLIIDWKITDALTFSTQSWTSRGGMLEFTYAFDGGWETSIAGGRERERFRLDGGVAGLGEGVGEENSLPITLTVGKTLSEGMKVEAYGGLVVDGELRVETQPGVGTPGTTGVVSQFDRSWFVGAALTVPF